MPGPTIDAAKDKMHKTVVALGHEFATIRTGRASGSIFEKISLDYYGAPTPLLQIASVNAPEANLLVISPYDRTAIGAIEKAILASDLGLNPSNDGVIIRVPIPSLTEERRRELVKMCGKYAEESRVGVRNVRRDANDQLKKSEKDGNISQDDLRRAEAEIQKLTDANIREIDEMLKRKELEIMEV
jgi:ribosome recycling factor